MDCIVQASTRVPCRKLGQAKQGVRDRTVGACGSKQIRYMSCSFGKVKQAARVVSRSRRHRVRSVDHAVVGDQVFPAPSAVGAFERSGNQTSRARSCSTSTASASALRVGYDVPHRREHQASRLDDALTDRGAAWQAPRDATPAQNGGSSLSRSRTGPNRGPRRAVPPADG